jgi:hypothetical protein
MMMLRTLSRKLLIVILSVVVALGMVAPLSSLAYAEQDPYIKMYNTNGDLVDEIYEDQYALLVFDSPNHCKFVLEEYIAGDWADLESVFSEQLAIVGRFCEQSVEGVKRVLSEGTYRAKAQYNPNGEHVFMPPLVDTGWYEFSIVPTPTSPPPPETPPTISPSNPTPPAAAPASPAKSTPATSLGVASGSTKANKLTAALTEPTASFTLAPVSGIYPTGSAKFVLQKRSGSKWKSLSQKAVNLSSGKASYKLAKATDAATYRIQVSYSGDSKYNAVVTTWTTVKIAKGNGITKKALKVYSKASTKAKKLASFKKGKKIVITGKSGKYYKVSFKLKGKTRVGFVAKTSIKVKK